MRLCTFENDTLGVFREFYGPLQSPQQRRARKIGAPDVRRTKAGGAMEDPRLRVQACTAPVQRDFDFTSRESSEHVQCDLFRCSGVGRCQYAYARPPHAARVWRRRTLQHLHQLSYARHGDEADQNVDLIAVGRLTLNFVIQRWGRFRRREQPRCGETGLGEARFLAACTNGAKPASWSLWKRDGAVPLSACLLAEVQ